MECVKKILLSFFFAAFLPAFGLAQYQARPVDPALWNERLEVGPVEGLTRDWHPAPVETSIPLGTTVYFRIEAQDPIHWSGATLTGRRTWSSTAEYHADTVGPHVVKVEYTGGDGGRTEDRTVLNVVDTSLLPVRISGIRLSVRSVVIDEGDTNASTMRYFFRDESIGNVREISEDHYLMPVKRWFTLEADVDPPGFAPLIEWRHDGDPVEHLGPLRMRLFPPRTHTISVGPDGSSRKIRLDTYMVRLAGPARGERVRDGDPITLKAETVPPGYEDEITWMASTKYGTCEPLMGEGPEFTVSFEGTFGADGRQWLGVKADHAVFNQDVKDGMPAGTDCWRTVCGSTKFTFCDLNGTSLPAGFFDTGSEEFQGEVLFRGSGTDFDTSMNRKQAMFLPTIGSEDSTPIELEELHLVSCEPIVVLIDGMPTEWNVEVTRSDVPAGEGTLTATLTHENGGEFDAQFPLHVRFTFTRVDDPGVTRVLDTGELGLPPLEFLTIGRAPWVHKLVGPNPPFVCGVGFAPGVEQQEGSVTMEQCCRPVGHAGPGHVHETGPPDCTSCPMGACCDPVDGSCAVVETVDHCDGEYKGDGTDCSDFDEDGIADVMESNNCCGEVDNCNAGTDPNDPDTDGDGVDDGVERANGTDPCDETSF